VDLPVAERNRQKVAGVILNITQLYKLHRDAVEAMLQKNLTFGEAMFSGSHAIVKMRLGQVKNEVFEQLRDAGI
jgi:hypothetical protein